METGFRGTFVISWSQTETEGTRAAPVQSLAVGANWAWYGDAVCVDGPNGMLRLEGADGEAALRRRAARMVRRMIGAAVQNTTDIERIEVDNPMQDSSFVVTDGVQSYTVTLIEAGTGAPPLCMFLDAIPPKGRDLWVVHHTLEVALGAAAERTEGGVICFTPGTMIDTPDGRRPIDVLREGDLVQTKDNGIQPIVWRGARRMTGARLFAMPKLRPIRIRAGALGIERPDDTLLVSPGHRMVVKGAVARALFNTDEVLVTARDLINGGSIAVDVQLPEVTYIHLMFESHQVLWANGVETESFHPANTALETLDADDRARLLAGLPDLAHDPQVYGSYARRNLSASEARILMHEVA